MKKKIEVDIDIEKLIYSDAVKTLIEKSTKIEDLVYDILSDDEIDPLLKKLCTDVCKEYITSKEGTKFIINEFKSGFDINDMLDEDIISKAIVNALFPQKKTRKNIDDNIKTKERRNKRNTKKTN